MSRPTVYPDYSDGTGDHAALIDCPECGASGFIDEEQMRGEVSIRCMNTDCSYHETHDLSDQID